VPTYNLPADEVAVGSKIAVIHKFFMYDCKTGTISPYSRSTRDIVITF